MFFLSVGAYVAGALVAHSIAALTGYKEDLFSAQAANARFVFAVANPGVMLGLFLGALVLAAIAGAAFGVLASYPALRLRPAHRAARVRAHSQAKPAVWATCQRRSGARRPARRASRVSVT